MNNALWTRCVEWCDLYDFHTYIDAKRPPNKYKAYIIGRSKLVLHYLDNLDEH